MRRTVLVVSRNPKVRSALRALRSAELRLFEADSGLGALFTCASQFVDLLVIDVETPGMDWPILAGKLVTAFPAMPVVSVSGRGEVNSLATLVLEALDSAPGKKQPALATGATPFPEERGA
jgi:CheY-like chemotaxis protein